jgi:hypothetical protein
MKPSLVSAVIRRGGHRCAWCSCKLDTGLTCDRGTVCKLDQSEAPTSLVASCVACAAQYAMHANVSCAYSTANAIRSLARDSILESGPFVDYIVGATDNMAAFETALDRIEAQRHAPLDIRRAA